MCCLLQQEWDHWLPFSCAQVFGSSRWRGGVCEGSCHSPATIMELPPPHEGGKQGNLMLMAKGCSCLKKNSETLHQPSHFVTACLYCWILQCTLKYGYKHYMLRTLQLRHSDQTLCAEKFGLLLLFQHLVLLLDIVSSGSSFS